MTRPPWWAAVVLLAACRPPDGMPYRNPDLLVAERVRDLLARMTPEEKFHQLFMVPGDLAGDTAAYRHGVFGLQVRPWETEDSATAPVRAFTERIDAIQRWFVERTRLGIPIIVFEESLHGLVQPGATSYPQAIGLAATFDTALMGEVARAIARETRMRGVRQVLSPVVNLAADARWGRVEETYGEDPFLAAMMGLAYVRAFEEAGVVTSPKHFVANVGDGGRDSYPIALSARVLEETHFVPFRIAVRQGGARSVMASYNSVDGFPATASPWLLDTVLKQRWGFPGVVISDAGGTGGANVLHGTSPDYATSGALAINAGLDVIFQTSIAHAALFQPAFMDGRISAARIDDAVRRVLRVKFELGLFDHPYVDAGALPAGDRARAEDRTLARRSAAAAMVLLRNEGGTLPLAGGMASLAVIGVDAEETRLGGYSGSGRDVVSMLDGLTAALPATKVRYAPGPGRGTSRAVPVPSAALRSSVGPDAVPGLAAEYFQGIALEGDPALRRIDPRVDFTWTIVGPDRTLPRDWFSVRWTGDLVAPATETIDLGVRGHDGFRMWVDDVLLIDAWTRRTGGTWVRPVALRQGRRYHLRIEYHETRGDGRIALVWSHGAVQDGDGQVRRAVALARECQAAVVVVGVEEGEFRDRSSLALPGRQEAMIRAVAATGVPTTVVVVGGSPITMDWLDRVGAVVMAWYPGERGGEALADVLLGRVNPAGRLPVTFPASVGQVPLTYRHLPTGRGDDYLDASGSPLFPFGYGLSYTRFAYRDIRITPDMIAAGDSAVVRFRVTNAGDVRGEEVAQLYIRDDLASVGRPVLQLAAFQRVSLAPGEEKDLTIVLQAKDLALVDAAGKWRVEPGAFQVFVGASSVDLRLKGRLSVR